jgi:hypothetical protein
MTVKLLLLQQNPNEYLIGSLTELDEEPALFIQNCYKIIECAEYGEDPESLEKRAHSLENDHVKLSARKIDEGATDKKDWYVYEYAILEKFPKYSDQRDLFLTTESIFTILDPREDILKLYNRCLGS